MKRTDVLTLKEFWRPLKEKYPDALEHYCHWIDQLKLDVYWKLIFGMNNYPVKEPRFEGQTETRHPKAHELPAFLQLGIFMQYVYEYEKVVNFPINEDWNVVIERYFKNKQWLIDHRKQEQS